jgi:hypothetical protein
MVDEPDDKIICSDCKKQFDKDQFTRDGRIFKMCFKCREKGKKKDQRRSKNPKRIAYKKEKNKEKNYSKIHRAKKREENEEEYLAKAVIRKIIVLHVVFNAMHQKEKYHMNYIYHNAF